MLDILGHLVDVISPPAGVRALPFITLPVPEQLAIHGESHVHSAVWVNSIVLAVCPMHLCALTGRCVVSSHSAC